METIDGTMFYDKPCAVEPYISYRCKGRFGWIMIGATNHADALSEARRSSQEAIVETLEVWNGTEYVSAA